MTVADDERFDQGEEYLLNPSIQMDLCIVPRRGSAILNMNCNGYLGYACCSRILLIDLIVDSDRRSASAIGSAMGSAGFPGLSPRSPL
jgi:hypothetical protein